MNTKFSDIVRMHPGNCDKRITGQHQRKLIKKYWDIALKTGPKKGESSLFVVAFCLQLPFCNELVLSKRLKYFCYLVGAEVVLKPFPLKK